MSWIYRPGKPKGRYLFLINIRRTVGTNRSAVDVAWYTCMFYVIRWIVYSQFNRKWKLDGPSKISFDRWLKKMYFSSPSSSRPCIRFSRKTSYTRNIQKLNCVSFALLCSRVRVKLTHKYLLSLQFLVRKTLIGRSAQWHGAHRTRNHARIKYA